MVKIVFVAVFLFCWGGEYVCAAEDKSARLLLNVSNCESGCGVVIRPVEDCYFFLRRDTLNLSGGSVHIGIDVGKGGLIRLLCEGRRLVLYVQPGNRMEADWNIKTGEVSFRGDNAEGLKLFQLLDGNRKLWRYDKYSSYKQASLDSVPERMLENFRLMEQSETIKIDSLYRLQLINPDFRKFLKEEISCYYAALLCRVVENSMYRQQENGTPFYRGDIELLRQMKKKWPLSDKLMRMGYYQDYMTGLVKIEALKGGQITQDMPLYTLLTNNLKSGKLQEYLLAYVLSLDLINNKTFDRRVVALCGDFEKRYPQSLYSTYFRPYLDAIYVFEQKIKGDYPDGTIFVEDAGQINTLAELLDRFKGEELFVDFWFSTCGPCREQFAYNPPLKSFLKENRIKTLYVSVDSEQREQLWRDCIKYYDLSGIHIRAGNALQRNISADHKIPFFPTYMIVNQRGEIVVPRAKYPEEKEALYGQIREALGK